MSAHRFPTSQRTLLVEARGAATQSEFAQKLGVDRSCLSRYEQEKLGAPVGVLNECLRIVSHKMAETSKLSSVERALAHVRQAAMALEDEVDAPPKKIAGAQRSRTSAGKR